MKGNTEIVSLKLAVLARQKGFDEVTHFAYCFDTEKQGYYINYDPEYFVNSTLWEKHFAAPSREQLQIWLQKKGIFVIVDVDQTFEPKFAYKVSEHSGNGQWKHMDKVWSDLYYRYGEALDDGLIEALTKFV